MKNILFSITLVLAFGGAVNAQRIYQSLKPITGKKDIVSVEVPQGWVQQIAEKSNTNHGQLLTKNESSNSSILIQTIGFDDTYKTVEALIEREKLMYNVTPSVVHTLYPVELDKKMQAQLIRVSGSADGEQLVAFIPVKNSLVVITMLADDETVISENKTDFESLLSSFEFNPIINPPSFAEIDID